VIPLTRVSKGIALNDKLWKMLYAIQGKTGEKVAGQIERMILKPVIYRYEHLGLGKCDKEGLCKSERIGELADKTKPILFAGHAAETVETLEKKYDKLIKMHMATPQNKADAILRLKNILRKSLSLQHEENARVANKLRKNKGDSA
jgi:hypothetical protein